MDLVNICQGDDPKKKEEERCTKGPVMIIPGKGWEIRFNISHGNVLRLSAFYVLVFH